MFIYGGAGCFQLKENIINEIAFDSIAKALGIDHGTTVQFLFYFWLTYIFFSDFTAKVERRTFHRSKLMYAR